MLDAKRFTYKIPLNVQAPILCLTSTNIRKYNIFATFLFVNFLLSVDTIVRMIFVGNFGCNMLLIHQRHVK